MAIDPAGRGGARSDELAYAIVAELNGNLFLLEAGGSVLGYAEEVLKMLAMRAKRWNISQVVAEKNFGAGLFEAVLTPVMNKIHPCGIESVNVSMQKERRICQVLGPVIQQHKLVVNSELIRKDYLEAERSTEGGHERSLMFQCSRITEERNALSKDDRIDALALAVQFFSEAAAQDQQLKASERAYELWQNQIEMASDETGASIDALALGLPRKTINRSYGGIRRGVSCRRL